MAKSGRSTARRKDDAALSHNMLYWNETVRTNLERRLLELALISSVQPRVANDGLRERSALREIRFPSPLEIPIDLPPGFLSPLHPSNFTPATGQEPVALHSLVPPEAIPSTPLSPRPGLPLNRLASSSLQTPMSPMFSLAALAASSYMRKDTNPLHLWDATCPTLLDGLLPLLVAEGFEEEADRGDAADRYHQGDEAGKTVPQATATSPRRPRASTYAGYVWSVSNPGDSRIYLFKGHESSDSRKIARWSKREKGHVNWMLTMLKSMSKLGLRWSKFKTDPKAREMTRRFVFGSLLFVLQRLLRLSGKAWVTAMPLLIGFLDSNPDVSLYLPEEAMESLMTVLGDPASSCGVDGSGAGVSPSQRSDHWDSVSRGASTPASSPPSSNADFSINLSIADLLAHDPEKSHSRSWGHEGLKVDEDDDGFFSASSLRSPASHSSPLNPSKGTPPVTPPNLSPAIAPSMAPPIKVLPPPLVLPKRVDVEPPVSFASTSLLSSSLQLPGEASKPNAPQSFIPTPLSELRRRIKVVIGRCERVVSLDDSEALKAIRARQPDGAKPDGNKAPTNMDPEFVRLQLIADGPDSETVNDNIILGQMVDSVMSLSTYFEKFLANVSNSKPKVSGSSKPKRSGISSPMSPFGRGFFSPVSPISPRPGSGLGTSARMRKAAASGASASHGHSHGADVSYDAARSDYGKSWFWSCQVDERRRVLRTSVKLASVAAGIISLLRACCDAEYRHRILEGDVSHISFMDHRDFETADIFLSKHLEVKSETGGSKAESESVNADEKLGRARMKLSSILQTAMGVEAKASDDIISQWSTNAASSQRVNHLDALLNSVASPQPTEPAASLHPVMMAFSAFASGRLPLPANGKIRISASKMCCHLCFKFAFHHNLHCRRVLPGLGSSNVRSPRSRSHHYEEDEEPEEDNEMVIALLGSSSKIYPNWIPPYPISSTSALTSLPREPLVLHDENWEASASLAKVIEQLGDELEEACRRVLGNLAGSPSLSAANALRYHRLANEGSEGLKGGVVAESPPVSTFEVTIDTSDWLK
ncbi:hypothetical protein HDU67_002621 [Dinochytrium kinnereticum]|nr:hypothetical protein HDU67_002621 [Dinochytrium kinnereticum]